MILVENDPAAILHAIRTYQPPAVPKLIGRDQR